MSQRFLCIHGHFYQPPRENPWLEAIERQDSAYPYHDWNERVTAECYAPNAASRILDDEGRIVRIVNNYARISFNFGPTLLTWMEEHAPEVYGAVLEADAESARRFGGHGSALAQAYNHTILPLSTERDRRTQIRWGVADFRHRFGRMPEGMWLPETAVDVETLEILAEEGIAFTILAPHQIQAVRRLGERSEGEQEDGEHPDAEEGWTEVSQATLDTTRPYRVPLPSGRSIAVFPYDGALSRAVAFERLLADGSAFARRLVGAFPEDADGPALVHIATDGETYGHHHAHGEMALSYALARIGSDGGEAADVRLTNYAEYLALHPPEWEARIAEETSWSCAHGVDRWRADCGCHAGRGRDWTQAWRGPLRDALDWLRDEVAPLYEEGAGKLVEDPWAARDDYVEVMLDRSPGTVDAVLGRHARRELGDADRVRLLQLLELQRHALLMYTSCGWFFDELTGIETVQVLLYAGRVVHLAEQLSAKELEGPFLRRLSAVPTNLPERGDGARVYREAVEAARVDLRKVGAHFAVSSLFEEYGEESRIYAFTVERLTETRETAGRAALAAGRIRVTSEVTRETATLTYGVLHLGDHTLAGGAREFRGRESYHDLLEELTEPFARADFPAVLRVLDRHFPASSYTLRSLFGDEQRRILGHILESTLEEAEGLYRQLYEDAAPLMRFLGDVHVAPPRPLRMAAEYVLSEELKRAFAAEPVEPGQIRELTEEVVRSHVAVEEASVAFAAERSLERLMDEAAAEPRDPERLRRVLEVIESVEALPFEVNLWGVQNRFYDMLRETASGDVGPGGPHGPDGPGGPIGPDGSGAGDGAARDGEATREELEHRTRTERERTDEEGDAEVRSMLLRALGEKLSVAVGDVEAGAYAGS